MGKPPISHPVALDERLVISYLARMATRLLLTLLALLTGLAAQLSPAQARVGAGVNTEIGATAGCAAPQRRNVSARLVCPPLQRRTALSRAAHGLDRSKP